MTWHRLLRTAGVALVLLLVAAAAGFRDIEAAALAVAGLFGLALLRFRMGLLGIIGLGVLFADVAAWMAPGAISNLTHQEPWIATALPSALAIVSLAGLAGLIAALVGRRRRPISEGRAPAVVGLAAIVLIVATNIAGAVTQTRVGSPIRPGDIGVTARHVRFEPDRLTAKPGRIGVTVGNLDLFWHTFTIRTLGVNLRVPVQGERRVVFSAEPGTYEFLCAIPGHTQAGMKGTLRVG
ncbi:MAG TPA: cupredoxin domain-containing protein [Actinomycetota bacterium]|jgi:plastocyanin|nr:cupredoxin domain-containing protein [Actinomycetota bacterium]